LQIEQTDEIVRKLQHLKREIVKRASNRLVEPNESGERTQLSAPEINDPLKSQFTDEICRLNTILKNTGFDPSFKEEIDQERFWSVGSMLHRKAIRDIHLGYLEPVLRVPLLKHVPALVVAFLITIHKDKHLLKRERHDQMGWHYHYLDHKKTRSDVVICWDTKIPYNQGTPHPLFQEKHGQGFKARPDLWGTTKCQSMHSACSPDLNKWPICQFRCKSKNAWSVWP
jgi:hypothetical protein